MIYFLKSTVQLLLVQITITLNSYGDYNFKISENQDSLDTATFSS
jgi:hypothetical protein